MTARRASWLVLMIVVSITLAVAASDDPGPADAGARVDALTRTIKCPTCPSQSVAESDVPLAHEIRVDLARRVADGQSDDDIRTYYVSRYGQEVLLTPPRSGIAGLVWVLPVAALLVALVVLAATFRRWSAEGGRAATAADRAIVDAALHDEGDDAPGGAGG